MGLNTDPVLQVVFFTEKVCTWKPIKYQSIIANKSMKIKHAFFSQHRTVLIKIANVYAYVNWKASTLGLTKYSLDWYKKKIPRNPNHCSLPVRRLSLKKQSCPILTLTLSPFDTENELNNSKSRFLHLPCQNEAAEFFVCSLPRIPHTGSVQEFIQSILLAKAV